MALQIMVWILLASFVIVLFTIDVPWGEVFKGFIPQMNGGKDELITLAGLMGAAIAINVPMVGAYGCVQNKWTPKRFGLSMFENTFTNIMLWLVQAVVIIACASVLYPAGIIVTGAGTMAQTFQPFAGRFGVVLMCIGLLGSVLSTMASQLLAAGYFLTDAFGWEADLSSRRFKNCELVITLFGLSAPIIGWNAFALSTYGAGFNLTFFPIASMIMLYLYNRKDVMGENKAKPVMNVLIVIAIAISLIATVNYWVNLLK